VIECVRRRGVLFQGEELMHAVCWRDDPGFSTGCRSGSGVTRQRRRGLSLDAERPATRVG
jgi:hypothetical protein